MSSQSAIVRAIAELQAERAHVAARLANLDEAIAAVRKALSLPAGVPAVGSPRETPKARRGDRFARPGKPQLREAIVTALGKGPMSPADLAAAVGLKTSAAMYHVKALASAGVVALSGSTTMRRVALSSTPTTKEVP